MKKKASAAFLALALSLGTVSSAAAYTNPFTFTSSWTWNDGSFYGEGDPYILKHNGTYYLYVSTVDDKSGVKVWTSTDLVNWAYAGICTTEAVTKAAYAPEVVYWNGYFYMYTSPAGNGHYVLRSENPLGPFTVQTGNKGLGIDGHVFIDDDGKWYFYHTGSGYIAAAPMSDPYTFGAPSNTGAEMNGWTEGATVLKRSGKYVMTYTGNHVWNKAYRVDYGVSTNPAAGFQKQAAQNPVLINSEGSNVGLGHNGIVVGPDLDTHYMVYHSHANPGRRFNMDRIVWNGDRMSVLGPTTTAQPNPDQPVFQDRFNRTSIGSGWTNVGGGTWGIYNSQLMWQDTVNTTNWYRQVTTAATAGDYTAEFHMKQMGQGASTDPRFGAVFSYTDENNYGMAVLNKNKNQLQTQFRIGGVDQGWVTTALPAGYDYTKWHSLRVEKADRTFKIYVDGMLKQTRSYAVGGGRIGYTTQDAHADFGYAAFSNKVSGSSAFDAYKPVPGTVEAVHFREGGEGVGYHDNTPENIGGAYRKEAVDIRSSAAEGKNIVGWNQTGEWLNYRVNVAETGTYDVDLRVATNFTGAKVRIWDGGTDLTGIRDIPSTGDFDSWQTVTLKGLNLAAGQRELRVEFVNGEFDLSGMKFSRSAGAAPYTDDFNDGNDNGWTRFEGAWSLGSGVYTAGGGTFSKSTFGDPRWGDYTVESDIKMIDSTGDAGIMVRVNNPANGKELVDNPDYLQGYYAHLTTTGVFLGKFNYGWTSLASAPAALATGAVHHMKVVVSGSNIKVYVGDMAVPKINYTDNSPNPFTHGKTGLRANNKLTEFDNFKIAP